MELERTAQVWGITGNLGGGKTLSAVEMAVRGMTNGYFVVSNIELNLDRIAADFGEHCLSLYQHVDLESADPNEWPTGDPRGSGGTRRVLVILDEIAEWFDQYAGSSPQVRKFLSWLRHSSKRGQDVILVCQRKEFMAKSLRILVARWIWVEDLAVWRIPKLRIHIPFCGHLCGRCVRDRVGNILQTFETTRKSLWGKYYCTSQLLAGSMGTPYDRPQIKRKEPMPPESIVAWGFLLLYASQWIA